MGKLTKESGLSDDARVLVKAWFSYGEKTTVTVGGEGARSVLSERGRRAVDELVAGGYVTATEFNKYGRMQYQGTDKCRSVKITLKEMDALGKWSPTMPNPALKSEEPRQ